MWLFALMMILPSSQQDLNKLADWEEKWQMKFHPEKCQVIRVTLNRVHKIESTYILYTGTRLEVDAAII